MGSQVEQAGRFALAKHEIAMMLAERYGYSSYLEICSPTTGNTYSLVDQGRFPRRVRLMYRCPPEFSDGELIDFRVEADACDESFGGELLDSGERFGLVFVDPWHSYSSSRSAIEFGLKVVAPWGLVLVHDCSPPDAD